MVSKKYKVIVKIGNNPDGSARCVKYNVNDLIRFASFLDKEFPDWRWFNIYDKETGTQIDNFTKKSRPTKRFTDIK
jgi:hypothetical protein